MTEHKMTVGGMTADRKELKVENDQREIGTLLTGTFSTFN
jgi:hypothetical protein